MELNQLKYFMVAAETEHMTRASKELFISQSALSRTISRLEKDLGVELFDRSGKSIYLNDYGSLVLDYSRKIFESVRDMSDAIADLSNGSTGSVRIGYGVSSNAPIWFDEAIQEFLSGHANVRFSVFEMDPDALASALQSREINIALTTCISENSVPPDNSCNIMWEPLFMENMGILISRNHRLAELDEIPLKALKNERFLLNNSNSDMTNLTRRLCAWAGFEPDIFCQFDRPETIGQMIASGFGLSFISYEGFCHVQEIHKYSEVQDQQLVFRGIADKPFSRTCYYGTLNGRYQSVAVQEFKQILLKSIAKNFRGSVSSGT